MRSQGAHQWGQASCADGSGETEWEPKNVPIRLAFFRGVDLGDFFIAEISVEQDLSGMSSELGSSLCAHSGAAAAISR